MEPLRFLNRIPGWLVLMGLLTALGPLAIDLYLPAFPAMAQDLGSTHGDVERTLASYLFGLALAQLFYGPVADRYGRKKPLLLGLGIFIIASQGCAMASDIHHLATWRILQAFGGAAGIVVPRAVIRDHYDTRDAARALSLLLLVMGLTPILAPIIGGQILVWASWRWMFHLMTLAAALLLMATVMNMRESLAPEKVLTLSARSIAGNYRALLRHRGFLCYSLAGGFGSAGMFTYIAGSPRVFISVYGVDPRWFGLLFGLNAASLIGASQLSARLLARHSPERLLRLAQTSLLVMSFCALVLTLAGVLNLGLLMLCLMGFMASQGFVNPNSAALALHEQGARLGAASAMMGSLQMLCGATAGSLISLWQGPGALPLTGLLAICAFLSWLAGRLARQTSSSA